MLARSAGGTRGAIVLPEALMSAVAPSTKPIFMTSVTTVTSMPLTRVKDATGQRRHAIAPLLRGGRCQALALEHFDEGGSLDA